jgi:Flp pilus assembly protein TadD
MSFRVWLYRILTGSREKSLLMEGEHLLASGRYVQAQEVYREIVESWPNEPKGYFGMCKVFEKMGLRPEARREKAIGESLATLDDHPDDVSARLELAKALMEKDMYGWAAAHAEHALKIAPRKVEVLEAASKAYTANHNFDKAAAVLGEWVRKEPLEAELYKKWAFALKNSRQTSEAVRAASMAKALGAVSKDPGNALIVDQAVRQLLATGKRNLAMEMVDRSLKGNPNRGALHRIRGELLLMDRSYKEAMLTLRKAVELEPTDLKAHRFLSQAYAKEGFAEKAQQHEMLAETIEHAREGGDALATEVAMVRLLIDSGQVKAATKKAEEVARSMPEDWRAPFCKGLVFKAHGKIKEARNNFMKAKVMNNKAPDVQMEIAKLHSEIGESMEAIGFARQAVALSPRDPDIRRVLASILRQHNFMDQAIEEEDIADSLTKKPDKQKGVL